MSLTMSQDSDHICTLTIDGNEYTVGLTDEEYENVFTLLGEKTEFETNEGTRVENEKVRVANESTRQTYYGNVTNSLKNIKIATAKSVNADQSYNLTITPTNVTLDSDGKCTTSTVNAITLPNLATNDSVIEQIKSKAGTNAITNVLNTNSSLIQTAVTNVINSETGITNISTTINKIVNSGTNVAATTVVYFATISKSSNTYVKNCSDNININEITINDSVLWTLDNDDGYISIIRQGFMTTISCRMKLLKKQKISKNSGILMFSMPSAFKPFYNIYSSANTIAVNTNYSTILVDTNGNVYLKNFGSKTKTINANTVIEFSMTYWSNN